jgi:phosphate uptake regulator
VWKPLLTVFGKETRLDQAYSDTHKMLALTEKMFIEAKSGLRKPNKKDGHIDIVDADSRVNKFERKIRKKVMRHLQEKSREDIYSGLMLASIVIDIERIGDECKNVLGLTNNYHSKFKAKGFKTDLLKIESAVEDEFSRVRKQFKEGDSNDAEKMLEEYLWVNKLCDACEADLIKMTDKKLAPSNAVALALYIRHLKRINAHLRNVSTSVFRPFDKIGFTPKTLKNKH